MGQGNWNGTGQNGYQMPPVSSSGNVPTTTAAPPLPSLPPPPPPPPPPPALATQFEPPPPGSGMIKFTIPSKGNNKLQKAKQEKQPNAIQVPQYPSNTQTPTTSSPQVVENKPPEPIVTQAKSSGMPVDWPDSLRRYVERCFAMCKTSVDKDFVELILKGKITSASREGKALSKDWDSEPLPNLSRVS